MRAKLVKETLADKYIKQDPYLRAVPGEFDDFENKYAEEQQDEVFYKNGSLTIIKNPQNLSNFQKNVKGVISETGDLYLELTEEFIHNDILAVLKDKKLISDTTTKNWTHQLPDQTKFVTVQRVENTNIIAIGESNRMIYDKNAYDKYISLYTPYLEKAKSKCKNIEFTNKIIGSRHPDLIKGDHFVKK